MGKANARRIDGDTVMTGATGRRDLLRAILLGTGGLVSAGIVSAGTGPASAESANVNASEMYTAFRPEDYGALGNGTSDDTEALTAVLLAASADGQNGSIVLSGKYVFTKTLTLPAGLHLTGQGPHSLLIYKGRDVALSLSRVENVKLSNFSLGLYQSGATALLLSASFRCSVTSVRVYGNYSASSASLYKTQRGMHFTSNSGDNRVFDSDFNNLGIGVETDCAMNYFLGCVFGTCRVGFLGGDTKGKSAGAGASISNCTFVSSSRATTHHVHIRGSANRWWLSQVWMEGAAVGIEVGTSKYGPMQFSLSSAKVAATTNCLIVNNAGTAILSGVDLNSDAGSDPHDLTVSNRAVHGFATGVTSSRRKFVNPSAFPKSWTVIGADHSQVAGVSGGMSAGSEASSIKAVNKLPAARASLRGKLLLRTASDGDTVFMCIRAGHGRYEWKRLS